MYHAKPLEDTIHGDWNELAVCEFCGQAIVYIEDVNGGEWVHNNVAANPYCGPDDRYENYDDADAVPDVDWLDAYLRLGTEMDEAIEKIIQWRKAREAS